METPKQVNWIEYGIAISSTLLNVLALLRLELTVEYWMLFMVLCTLRISVTAFVREKGNVCSMIFWIYLEFSTFGWIALLPKTDYENLSATIQLPIVNLSISIVVGSLCIMTHLIVILIGGKSRVTRRNESAMRGVKNEIVEALWMARWVFCLGAFSISYIADRLGIAAMGQVGVALDFKISGLINILRVWIIPLVFLIIIDQAIKRKTSNYYLPFCMYIGWLLYESFIRASRGTLVIWVIPAMLLFIHRGIFNRRHLLVIVGVVATTVVLYPFITVMRSLAAMSGKSTFVVARDVQAADSVLGAGEKGSAFYETFERSFLAGMHIAKFSHYLDMRYIGWNFVEISKVGSPADYHTVVIDRMDLSVNSSGAASIAEGYLIGGLPLALGVTLFFSLLSVTADGERLGFLSREPVGKAYLAILILEYSNEPLIGPLMKDQQRIILAVLGPLMIIYLARSHDFTIDSRGIRSPGSGSSGNGAGG